MRAANERIQINGHCVCAALTMSYGAHQQRQEQHAVEQAQFLKSHDPPTQPIRGELLKNPGDAEEYSYH